MVLVSCLVGLASALMVKVDPKSEECFTQRVEGGSSVTVQFQVTAGGLLDIDCTIFDQQGGHIHKWNVATEGRHHFEVPAATNGAHDVPVKVCFGNQMARWTPKQVSFYIVTSHTGAKHSDMKHLDPIEEKINELSESVSGVLEEQLFLRSVEKVHREVVEQTHSRILYWAVFEAIILVLMGIFQVVHLRRFLNRKQRA